MKTNLFVVGVAKGGTTFISELCKYSKDICSPSLKEPHFFGGFFPFDAIEPHIKYVEEESAYEALYDFRGEKYRADYSTSYFFDKSACEELFKYNSSSKIIVCFREPISRAYSHYLNNFGEGVDSRSFFDAVSSEIKGEEGHFYLEYSKYSESLSQYVETFGSENVLIINSEEMFSNGEAWVIAKLARFLSIEPWRSVERMNRNSARVAKNSMLRKLLGFSTLRSLVRRVFGVRLTSKIKGFLYRSDLTGIELQDKKKGMRMLNEYFDEDQKRLKDML